MIATIAYYLGPLSNLLVKFFDNIELFLLITVLIKISLCGITMYNYLKYNYNSKYIFVFSLLPITFDKRPTMKYFKKYVLIKAIL